jgi:electron transfer flavoprotein alpha subunit
MAKVLIIAEHDGSALNPATAKCVSCAAAIDGAEIDVLVLAATAGDIPAQAASLDGVSRVLTVERPENENALAAVQAPQILALADHYSHVIGPSTTFGRDLMPRVAALLGVNQVTDIMAVEGSHTFAAGGSNDASIESISPEVDLPTHTRYVGLESAASDRPDLQTASRVVAGGRALGSEEQFDLIYQLADALGAAVGASRAAVDAGYCPNELQVGQTGKIIAPELYIAIGISGAIQHMTGIKDAGTIIAINKDEEAPIFEVADIGLVADLFSVVPELTAALSN